jgi:hypothetical protein
MPPRDGVRQVLVLSDSLSFHGPADGELTTEPRLWPNVMARLLTEQGEPTEATIYGRRGWTARDAWWAITRDPHVFSVLLPRADDVIFAVGGMDYLPTILPIHLREGVRLLRPEPVRKVATGFFRRAQPRGSKLFGGRWRTLPQALTDDFLTKCAGGVRYFHPDVNLFGVVPPSHVADAYGRVTSGHAGAIRSALAWGEKNDVQMLRVDEWTAPFIGSPGMNPDGIHWGWDCHRTVGEHAAKVLGTT